MRKILLIAVALIVMIGTAAAYNTVLYKDGTAVSAENPISIKPGDTVYVNYGGDQFAALNVDYPWYDLVTLNGGGAAVGQLTVTIPSKVISPFHPTSDPYTDTRSIAITLNASTPIGASFIVTIGAGGQNTNLEFDTASRTVNSVPEFPTIALPVAAILGLAFIFQRRREED